MKSGLIQLSVPLSRLASRRNPRKVKPSREAHHRLVALIRSQGLLQPLVVRPSEVKPKHFEVVAGDRRLRALREIHKGDGDPKIPCVLRDVDAVTADAMSLGENFGVPVIRERIFGQDYARTLATWRDNFRAAWPTLTPLGFDERFRRLWEYYLAYCEAGFLSGNIDVRQIVFAKEG